MHQKINIDTSYYNCSYFPIIFESASILLRIKNILQSNGIESRRYFFPALNNLKYISKKDSTPNANSLARRILCLPLYHSLKESEQNIVIKLILKNL